MDEPLTRREMLKRSALAAAGLVALPAVLAACKGSAASGSASAAWPTTATASPTPLPTPTPAPVRQLRVGAGLGIFNSELAEPARAGLAEVIAAFEAAEGPVTVALDTAAQFDEAGYFAREPADVASYYLASSMRYFAGTAGTLAPIDHIWGGVKADFNPAWAETLTHANGHVYGMPYQASPLVFFYRKSVFAAKGYTVPTTWPELLGLCDRMRKDHLIPIDLGNLELWPALGVFDMLNLRLNGYEFHMRLLGGNEKWTDKRVIDVFAAWRKLVPNYAADFATTKWQDSAARFARKQAGLHFTGFWAIDTFERADAAILDDLDCFEFPYFGNAWDAERTLEAPAEVWVLPSKSVTRSEDLPATNAYLEFWARGSSQTLMSRRFLDGVPVARDADASHLHPAAGKAFGLLNAAGHITQEMERDTRGDFISGIWYYLRDFLLHPAQDVAARMVSVQQYWDGLPPYQNVPGPTPEPS